MKGIEGFIAFNKEVTHNLDITNLPILNENNCPGIWKVPTLRSADIVYQSLFEVMEKLGLFEIIQSNYFRVILKHFKYFNILWFIRSIKNISR